MDLEVVWNGAHRGCNADLLFVDQHPPMEPPPVTASSRRRELEARTLADCAVLYELLSHRAATSAEIRTRLNWTADDVNHRIEALRTLGVNVLIVRKILDARHKFVNVYRVFPS